uniref:Uncharacterized protein n=1 Tax=Myripristis murdjan TaxID=586833 RepID=A0A667WRB8_9TELE
IPLHVAAKYGKIEVASLLLQKRAAPDAAGKVRCISPVHLAAQEGSVDLVSLLLRAHTHTHTHKHTHIHTYLQQNDLRCNIN